MSDKKNKDGFFVTEEHIDLTEESYGELHEFPQPRAPHLWEAILSFGVLIAVMAVGIMVFEVDPHVPMFIGVIFAALMALKIGYSWDQVETAMKDGI